LLALIRVDADTEKSIDRASNRFAIVSAAFTKEPKRLTMYRRKDIYLISLINR